MHVCGAQGLETMEEVSASLVSKGSREQGMEAVAVLALVSVASASVEASVLLADHSHVHAARNVVSRTTRSAITQVARRIARFNISCLYVYVFLYRTFRCYTYRISANIYRLRSAIVISS